MADEDVKIVIKQKGTIPVYTKTKVGVDEVYHDESLEGKGTVAAPLKVSEKIIDDIADLQANKQDKLTAGEHITIDENNVISAEGGLPDGEPLSLYGTNEAGEPEAYKVKPEIVLHNKVLPEGYEELDYISNTVDGGQYIDTGVKIERSGYYDKANSLLVDGVNVALNLTDTFYSNFGNYNYVDVCAYTDVFSDPSEQFSLLGNGSTKVGGDVDYNSLKSIFGIDVTGNISWGFSDTEKDGTVVRIVIQKDTFAIKTSAKLDGDIVDGVIFGSDSITGNFGISLKTIIGGASFTNLAFGSESTYIPIPNDFVDIKAETTLNNYKLVVGENATSVTGTTAKHYTPNTITLFANNNENGITCSLLPTSIKRTTIWKNSEIVFDGVPCREIATGAVGMFDLVNAEFLHSPTETSFVAGNVIEYPYVSTDVINITGDEHIEIVKGLDNDEYVQLDYLESDGTCAIDLGIIPHYSSIFETKIKNEHIPNSPEGVRAIYGYWASDVSSQTGCGLRTTGYSENFGFDLCYINGITSAQTVSFIGGDTNWHTFKIGQTGPQGEVYVDDTRAFTYQASTVSGGRSIGLFGAFMGMGSVSNFTLTPSFIGKIAYFREYRRNNNYEDIVIHDFVPVKRKRDGVLGFYDKITGKFCTNEGTGTFTAGGEYGVKVNYVPDNNDFRTVMRNALQNNTLDSSMATSRLYGVKNSTLYGVGSKIAATNSTVVGYGSTANNDNATIVGANNTQVGGPNTTIIGHGNITQSSQSVVAGSGNIATGQNTTVVGVARVGTIEGQIGNNSTVVGCNAYNYNTTQAVIVGAGSGATGRGQSGATIVGYSARGASDTVVIGRSSRVNSQDGIAIGHSAMVGNNSGYSIAIGYGARVGINTSSQYSIAIGQGGLVQAEDAILLGRGANTEPHSFYVGFVNGAVKLLDSSFVIPYARLTSSSPVADYCLKYDANTDSLVWGEAGSNYELPTATKTRLGGVKVGNGLSVTNDGTLSADVQSLNFENIGGDPHDNQPLSYALTGLQNNIDTVQNNLNTVESNLQAQIDNMSSIGEFLAVWDCDTGVARYLNAGFVYPTGGYFIIGSVAAAGQPNYMPDGSTYTGPSTTVTTEDVKVSDMWFYDGTHWIYLANHERQIAVDADLSTTSINPVQNKTIAAALDGKQDTLQAGKGITITDNVISASGDSVGVPQIANVYSKQLNTVEQVSGRTSKEARLGFYSDILFNLNLTKDQILDKMDELYIGIERFKRNKVTSGILNPEDPASKINYRNIPNFKLQNDKFVHLDQKMFCYRYKSGKYDIDDPRNYVVFYTDAEYTDYQTMMNVDPIIWCFYGQWIDGNQPSCLNTLRPVGVFSDYENGTLGRYPDGDLEVFVNVDKVGSIDRGFAKQRKCRSYIIDGVKKYFWSYDWWDSTQEVYTTADGKIPDSYVNTIISENKTVNDYTGMEYTQRSDLDYWHFNFDNFAVSEWIENVLEPATLLNREWGDNSQHASWKCYWLDYPLQPVLLQDCEVSSGRGWLKLKELTAEELPENPIFRYPYNTAELWLRFSAWQKRCMYNEYNDVKNEYLQLTQKQALAFAWEWEKNDFVTDKRAFGRQRNRYSGYNTDAKICEYIQFNLYTPYNVYSGTKSKSTPIKKRLVINQHNGSSTIRD